MKNSTKIFSASAVIVVIVVAILLFTIRNDNKVAVAKVNGVTIYQDELQAKIDNIFTIDNFGGSEVKSPKVETLPEEVLELLAKEVYLEKELLKKAKSSRVANSQEVKNKIDAAKDQIIRKAYIDDLVNSEVTQEVIVEKYNKLSQELEGKKEYQVFHIVTKDEEGAKKAYAELKKSNFKNFESVASKYSIDQISAQKGGELGYIVEDNMIKEIADVINKLNIGDVSEPVQTKFGWHIIKLNNTRQAEVMPFEDVKDGIRNQLVQDVISRVNAEISKDSKVEILIDVKSEDIEENSAQKGNIEEELLESEDSENEDVKDREDEDLELEVNEIVEEQENQKQDSSKK